MNIRAASPKDSDAVLALGKLPNSWRCGIGRFATEHLRMGLQSVGKPSTQLVERDGAVFGFAWIVATGSDASRIHIIAAAGPVFLALLDWACGSCRQRTVLRTSALVGGHASATLTARGFIAYSTQRWMQLRAGASPVPELPGPYRFAEFEERQLASLLATFFAAWPGEDDAMEATRSFRESDGLVLVQDVDDVVGYASWELLPNGCAVIHDVAVHPAHRRRGIGAAATAFAVQSLRPCARRIELLVMDRNPAERIYERMGFELVEDTVNLGGRFGLR